VSNVGQCACLVVESGLRAATHHLSLDVRACYTPLLQQSDLLLHARVGACRCSGGGRTHLLLPYDFHLESRWGRDRGKVREGGGALVLCQRQVQLRDGGGGEGGRDSLGGGGSGKVVAC
jgi:hypothetical protein